MKKILLVPLAIAGAAVALAPLGASSAASGAPPYNLDRAVASQRALLAQAPGDAAGHNDLGNLLVLEKGYDAAYAEYQQALALDPQLVSARYNLALLEMKRGERRAALKELRRVVELDPANAWAHYQIGTIYLDWHIDPLAERAFARAFRIEPRLSDARVNPHVIDNPLVTRAMLRAHSGRGEAISTPRVYEEPARVAAWMIDVPAAAPADRQAEAEAADPRGGGVTRSLSGGQRGEAADEVGEVAEEPSDAPKQLTASDLDRSGATNQVGGGAAAGVAIIGGAVGSTAAPSGEATIGGRRIRPVPPARTPPTAPGGANPRPGVGPAPRFNPAPGSTGQLDLRLLPPATPDLWAGVAAVGAF